MRPTSARFDPDVQRQPFVEVRNLASSPDLRGRELALRLPHPAQGPLYPWTLLANKGLNVPEGETARHDDLDAIGVDLDSRVCGAIRAPDPVRKRRHGAHDRDRSGGQTCVQAPQLGDRETDKYPAAPSFPAAPPRRLPGEIGRTADTDVYVTGTLPPSTAHAAPVTFDARSEHRKLITAATSSSVPMRPSGALERVAASTSSWVEPERAAI